LLLVLTSGNSSLLLNPVSGNSLVLVSLAGKQFDLFYFYREETNYNGKYEYKIKHNFFPPSKVRSNCFPENELFLPAG
jgi:hypothetical protein